MAYFIKILSIPVFPLQTLLLAEPSGRRWLKDTELEKGQFEKLRLISFLMKNTLEMRQSAGIFECWVCK